MNPSHSHLNLRFVGEANFEAQVLQSKRPVLVAFVAPWSKPCHVIDPVLRDVAQTCAGKIEVVTVDADDNPNLSLRYGVQHIPTLLYFEAGNSCGRLVGTASKEAILNFVSRDSESRRGNVFPSNGRTA
jgi:thioredoxin 1